MQYGWSQVELWQDTYASWPAQQYPNDSRDDQTGQRVTLFGSGEPPGSDFLLYYAPGWNSGTHAVPVLLVMGANDTVDREYADPDLGGSGTCGSLSCPSTGLMQYLSSKGYEVFDINFANPQGDNYQWKVVVVDLDGGAAAQALGLSEGAAVRDVMLKTTVDGEFTTTQDVAQAALFFASFEPAALTGQSLVVSHGWSMQ